MKKNSLVGETLKEGDEYGWIKKKDPGIPPGHPNAGVLFSCWGRKNEDESLSQETTESMEINSDQFPKPIQRK